jgi:hypothetical protein
MQPQGVDAVLRLIARATAAGRTAFDPNFMVKRARTANVVTQRVSRVPPPGGKNVKADQAWKYKGGKIVRANSIEINGRYYTDPKEDDAGAESDQGQPALGKTTGTPRRKQESNFMLTINPNKVWPKDQESAAKTQMQKTIEQLGARPDGGIEPILQCVVFGPKSTHYKMDRAMDVIDSINFKGCVEIGEQKDRMHCHVIMYVTHYSQVQINARLTDFTFRSIFNSIGPYKLDTNVYVQAKLLPQSDWASVMINYIRKGMQGPE